MEILAIGVNHKTAPLEVREKIFIPKKNLYNFLNNFPTKKVIVLSTCNRFEIYSVVENIKDKVSAIEFFKNLYKGDRYELDDVMYIYNSTDAIMHLFRVTSSLDSMVIGETQITGQVKKSYFRALELKSTGKVLNRLFEKALSTAKRVRRETRISEKPISASSVAVELIRNRFNDLRNKVILLIGAGKMSELAAKGLIGKGAESIFISNRHFDRALKLAEKFKGGALRLDEIKSYIIKADIIISSTESPHSILSRNDLFEIMVNRSFRELFIIDLAVPRDIDPEAKRIEEIHLYNIDDLRLLVEENRFQRLRDFKKAEKIIEEEVKKFSEWLNGEFKHLNPRTLESSNPSAGEAHDY